jgi:hypothetical protein
MTAQYGALCREIVIDSTNNQIVFTENGGSDELASIAEGTYFLDDSADGLLAAIVTALNAVSSIYTFGSELVQVSPGLNLSSPVDALWCACWIFATPDPTVANNVVFKWSHASTTFDPKLIGMDLNGSDLTWYDEGSYTRAYSTHAPTPVFVPNGETPLQDNDDPTANADVVTHVSPNNVRTHYVVRDLERRKVLSWGMVKHDRVHLKDTGLNFTGEEWGCFDTIWRGRLWRGGRLRLYAWDVDPVADSSNLDSTDLVGTYVFADGPPGDLPATRVERSQRLYDVGPLVLAPYVTP